MSYIFQLSLIHYFETLSRYETHPGRTTLNVFNNLTLNKNILFKSITFESNLVLDLIFFLRDGS